MYQEPSSVTSPGQKKLLRSKRLSLALLRSEIAMGTVHPPLLHPRSWRAEGALPGITPCAVSTRLPATWILSQVSMTPQ